MHTHGPTQPAMHVCIHHNPGHTAVLGLRRTSRYVLVKLREGLWEVLLAPKVLWTLGCAPPASTIAR